MSQPGLSVIRRNPLSASAAASLSPEQRRVRSAYLAGDFAAALTAWEQDAQRGEAWAQFCLAVAQEKGQGTRRNAESAMAWYRRAAEQGFAPGGTLVSHGSSPGPPGRGEDP